MRHIGVAVIKDQPRIALPLNTLAAKRGEIDHDVIDTLVAEQEPQMFVVGLPMNMDGTPSKESRRARRFGEHLARRYHCRVDYVDERLTTREAIDFSNQPNPDHSLAALVIAESWLTEQNDR